MIVWYVLHRGIPAREFRPNSDGILQQAGRTMARYCPISRQTFVHIGGDIVGFSSGHQRYPSNGNNSLQQPRCADIGNRGRRRDIYNRCIEKVYIKCRSEDFYEDFHPKNIYNM